MKKWMLLFVLATALSATTYAQSSGAEICAKRKMSMSERSLPVKSPNTPKHAFDVIHYALEIDLYNNYFSPYPNTFSASNRVVLVADSVIDTVVFNAENASLTIDSIVPASMSFTHASDLLQISLGQSFQVGDTVNFTIYYKHKEINDGGFYSNNGFVFTDSEPIGARKWIPCWDWPSDKATFEIKAKVPSTVMLASNGRLQDSIKDADTTYYHWVSRDPMSTYLMIITSKDGYNLKTTYWHPPLHPQDSVEMRFYYNTGENPQAIIDLMSPMADFFSNKFVEHPFEKNGFATLSTEFAWGGMENQSLTSLCPNCWDEMLCVHEFAHQWFGDMITCATWADIWINEGFATFSEALWKEHRLNYSFYKAQVESDADYYLAHNPGWAISNPSWAITPPSVNVLFDYAITYQKGAAVVAQLRYVMGDSAFFKGMKDYTNDAVNFKLNNATIPDFFAKMEQSSGLDLQWFMNEWIYKPNHPIYEINTQIFDNQVRTVIKQTSADFFKMPVELKYTFSDQTDTLVRVMNQVNNETFDFVFPKTVVGIKFDPNREILLKQAQSNVSVVDETGLEKQFFLYPNPLVDELVVSFGAPSFGDEELIIRNSGGQEVYRSALAMGVRTKTISLDNLAAGVYTVQWLTNATSKTKKIVVVK